MSGDNRISAADSSDTTGHDEGPQKALNLMHEALSLLDVSDGPHDVCAHLDVAINRLNEFIAKRKDAGV